MKRLLFVSVIAVFCISCTGFIPLQEESFTDLEGNEDSGGYMEIQSTTHIYFVNSFNNFTVDIFDTHLRDNKITEVPALGKTKDIPWFPTQGSERFPFYLTYNLPIAGTGVTIPFIPPSSSGTAYAETVIKYNQKNEIPIYDLRSRLPASTPIINNVGIIIKNNCGTLIRFLRGNTILEPVNNSSNYVIPHGESGFYRINPSNSAAGYSINMSGPESPLPPDITSLQAGYIYIITVNNFGTPVLDDSFPLTISSF